MQNFFFFFGPRAHRAPNLRGRARGRSQKMRKNVVFSVLELKFGALGPKMTCDPSKESWELLLQDIISQHDHWKHWRAPNTRQNSILYKKTEKMTNLSMKTQEKEAFWQLYVFWKRSEATTTKLGCLEAFNNITSSFKNPSINVCCQQKSKQGGISHIW